MAVEIKLFEQGGAEYTDEGIAAKDLRDLFHGYFQKRNEVNGSIYIIPSVQIYGQNVRDIDLVVMGQFDNLYFDGMNTRQGEGRNLKVSSFLVNIELKSMPEYRIKLVGSDYIVSYENTNSHNASEQCRKAKYALLNHIKEQLCYDPFVVDLLWFKSLTLANLTEIKNGRIDNALPASFSVKEFFETIAKQASISKNDGSLLNTFRPSSNISLSELYGFLTEVRNPEGLTLRKFNAVCMESEELDQQVKMILNNAGSKMNYLSGRAGTGKTILLLQTAYQLVNKEHKRCKILTYNHALVSDIKRLIDYTKIPEGVDKQTLSISTFDSFFQSMLSQFGLIDRGMDPTKPNYRQLYGSKLEELKCLLQQKCDELECESIKDSSLGLDWDYILIDEAQDVSDLEKDLFFLLYSPHRLVIADGVDQFVKSNARQDWCQGVGQESLNQAAEMTLERRQKANIVRFLNALSYRAKLNWKVEENKTIPGGEIIVEARYTSDIHIELERRCVENKCENYDILILVPPSMAENGKFRLANAYKNAKINLFDGVDYANRTKYPTHNECRLYQYDSCRGLEGWCVVCLNLDELVDYKKKTCTIDTNSLLSEEEQRKRYALLWTLIPLSRPIDTLVITLQNPQSEIGEILKDLCVSFSDFATWKIE